jgi:hypothetical protein
MNEKTNRLQNVLGKLSFSKRKSGGSSSSSKMQTTSDNPRWEVRYGTTT